MTTNTFRWGSRGLHDGFRTLMIVNRNSDLLKRQERRVPNEAIGCFYDDRAFAYAKAWRFCILGSCEQRLFWPPKEPMQKEVLARLICRPVGDVQQPLCEAPTGEVSVRGLFAGTECQHCWIDRNAETTGLRCPSETCLYLYALEPFGQDGFLGPYRLPVSSWHDHSQAAFDAVQGALSGREPWEVAFTLEADLGPNNPGQSDSRVLHVQAVEDMPAELVAQAMAWHAETIVPHFGRLDEAVEKARPTPALGAAAPIGQIGPAAAYDPAGGVGFGGVRPLLTPNAAQSPAGQVWPVTTAGEVLPGAAQSAPVAGPAHPAPAPVAAQPVQASPIPAQPSAAPAAQAVSAGATAPGSNGTGQVAQAATPAGLV